MDLEFVKEIPGDRSYSKMQIYRIVNAEKFFADNGRLRNVNANWLGVAPNGPAYPGTIRLFFIASDDVPKDLKDVYQHDRMEMPYIRNE
jgi:hypothetical protein